LIHVAAVIGVVWIIVNPSLSTLAIGRPEALQLSVVGP
jgi:hypothetical protein